MDLLQSIAMDFSMVKWGCRKKCTFRVPVDSEGEANTIPSNKNVVVVVDIVEEQQTGPSRLPQRQPTRGKAEEGDGQKRLILRIKQGERATLVTKEEEKPTPKPCPRPHQLVEADDRDWTEEDEKDERKRRSKRKRAMEEINTKQKEEKKEIARPPPQFLFRLTQEQIAEDLKLFFGCEPSRRKRRRQLPNVDSLCPGSSLPGELTMDRYR